MLDVVGALDVAATAHLGDGALHRAGHPVGVEDRPAVQVARGAAAGLDQRAVGAQEALLVGVEDRHQRHLGQVEPLAQQVDAHQHVEVAEPQAAQDLDPLDRVDVAVQVAHPHAGLLQVVGEVLGHALGERGDQHPLALLARPLTDLAEQVVDLALDRADLDHRIDQAGGPDDLLDHDALESCSSYSPGVADTRDHPRHQRHELVEAERPVVERRRQPEAVLDQRLLAGAIAVEHPADLRQRHVRLVDHDEEVGRGNSRAGRPGARPAARPDRWRE